MVAGPPVHYKTLKAEKMKDIGKGKKKLCKERKTVAGVYLTKGEEQGKGKGKGKNSEGMGHGHKSSGSSSKNNLSHLP